MKKIVTVIAAVLTVAALLSSCANRLTLKNGGVYDPGAQIYYSYAPMNYEAIGWVKDVFITDAAGFSYHAVTGSDGSVADTSLYLYDKDSKQLIYNSDTELPSFEEFAPDAMFFGIEDVNFVKISEVSDKDEIAKAVEIYTSAPSCAYTAENPSSHYRVKFTSAKYPYLAFIISYLEYSRDIKEFESVKTLDGYVFREGVEHETVTESDGSITVIYNYGRYFFFDREAGRCYMAGYIHDTYNATEKND